jgi:DNA-binding response OmpR family regulator
MKILIAEDDLTSRRILEGILGKWGYAVVTTSDGLGALEALQRKEAPPLAIVDWMMPGMDGVEFCHQMRKTKTHTPTYIILLTSKGQQDDIVAGLESGANDYIRKPFDREELRARIRVGERVVELQSALAERIRMLEEALAKIKTLHGLLPICCYCKKIRNDQDYWQQIEAYVADHSQAEFTHGICPDCIEKHIKGAMRELGKMKERKETEIP